MAIIDYRLNPFLNVLDIRKITGEKHQVPNQSPFTVRLNEVPQKTDPTSVTVTFADGRLLTEVAAMPAQGQYWPDYNTSAHGIADWNTGTLLFNSADAGKTISVSYNGTGALVDDRLQDMLELSVTSSKQQERDALLDGSTGAYGYPIEKAAKVSLLAAAQWLDAHPDVVMKIYFCCFNDREMMAYQKLRTCSTK